MFPPRSSRPSSASPIGSGASGRGCSRSGRQAGSSRSWTSRAGRLASTLALPRSTSGRGWAPTGPRRAARGCRRRRSMPMAGTSPQPPSRDTNPSRPRLAGRDVALRGQAGSASRNEAGAAGARRESAPTRRRRRTRSTLLATTGESGLLTSIPLSSGRPHRPRGEARARAASGGTPPRAGSRFRRRCPRSQSARAISPGASACGRAALAGSRAGSALCAAAGTGSPSTPPAPERAASSGR